MAGTFPYTFPILWGGEWYFTGSLLPPVMKVRCRWRRNFADKFLPYQTTGYRQIFGGGGFDITLTGEIRTDLVDTETSLANLEGSEGDLVVLEHSGGVHCRAVADKPRFIRKDGRVFTEYVIGFKQVDGDNIWRV